jgi:hypothetical protein
MSLQLAWASCAKCQGMFYGPFRGVCPADGQPHLGANSFRYTLLYSEAPSGAVQGGWASCPKCQGMHFAGFPTKGVCPADHKQHSETNSFAYSIKHGLPPAANLQTGWRACPKCQGLYYGPGHGHCPAGGTHIQDNSFDYAIDFIPQISPTLELVEELSETGVVGHGFWPNSAIPIVYSFRNNDGPTTTTNGTLQASADGNGNFGGISFKIFASSFDIEAAATDLTTGIKVVAPTLRPTV